MLDFFFLLSTRPRQPISVPAMLAMSFIQPIASSSLAIFCPDLASYTSPTLACHPRSTSFQNLRLSHSGFLTPGTGNASPPPPPALGFLPDSFFLVFFFPVVENLALPFDGVRSCQIPGPLLLPYPFRAPYGWPTLAWLHLDVDLPRGFDLRPLPPACRSGCSTFPSASPVILTHRSAPSMTHASAQPFGRVLFISFSEAFDPF